MTDIATRRLRAHRLTGEPFTSAREALRWLGAVQAQDYAGAKWALGQRTRGTTDADIDRLVDAGEILRTHVMRPTWHFVLPEDIRWLLELTAPRVRSSLASRYRELDIGERVMTRAAAAFAGALSGGRYLTRSELGEVLRAARISPEGQRLPHFLMGAELAAVIASGPRSGREFTYAMLDERAPRARALGRSEALAELAKRYFVSHGPAQAADFAWWSGLTVADARTGIALAGATLDHQVIDGNDYWSDPEAVATRRTAVAHLLANFDEYTVAYRDRGALVDPDHPVDPALLAFGSVLANVVTVGGRVRGAWRRTITPRGVRVEVKPVGRLRRAEMASINRAAHRLARFVERPVELAWL